MTATKPYVGTANSIPDSRTPRRFAMAISAMNPTAIQTRWPTTSGTADVIAMVPAVTLTAAVTT